MGYNQFFGGTTDTRLVLQKKDKSFFTDSDYQYLTDMEEVNYIVENDDLAQCVAEVSAIMDDCKERRKKVYRLLSNN